MSAYDQGPLAKYNSLTDRHLMGYFSNDRMRRHLVKNGLITKGGEVVSDAVYRVRIARREHRRRVRDLIAQAIIHKALEMERSRQIDIRKKIEEIAKIELVRRVRSDCNRLGDEECLSYFNEGNMESKAQSKTPKLRNKRSQSVQELDEIKLPTTPDQDSRQRLRRLLPNEEIETKHLSQLDSLTLGEYARILEKQDRYRMNKLPYLGMGTEFVRQTPKLPRRITYKKNKGTKKHSNGDESENGNVVHSARLSQIKSQMHTTVSILFHAPANNRNFDVMVIQQPSGANTLILYKESITNNTIFQVTSHRHKGFPFSLTFYIDNVKDSRISTCCEYKHKVGKRIGGPSGHFSLFSVEGDDPCFRCLAERDLANEKKEKKAKDDVSHNTPISYQVYPTMKNTSHWIKAISVDYLSARSRKVSSINHGRHISSKVHSYRRMKSLQVRMPYVNFYTKSNEQLSSRQESISVHSASEDKYKSDDDFESSSESSKSSSSDLNEEEEMDEEGEGKNKEEDIEEKKSSSSSSNSSSNKNSDAQAIVDVNINSQDRNSREKTPEIEINNDELEENENDLTATNSNNNAIEVDLVKHDNVNFNSGRMSTSSNGSNQPEVINPQYDHIIPIANENAPDHVNGKKNAEYTTNIHVGKLPEDEEDNGILIKGSISSSLGSESSDKKLIPIQDTNTSIVSSSEESVDDNSIKMKIIKPRLPRDEDSESNESVTNNLVVSTNKPNKFLNNVVDDNFDSESSRSSNSRKMADNENPNHNNLLDNKPIEISDRSSSTGTSSGSTKKDEQKIVELTRTNGEKSELSGSFKNDLILQESNVSDSDAVGDASLEVSKSPELSEPDLNFNTDIDASTKENVEDEYEIEPMEPHLNEDEPLVEIPNLSVDDIRGYNNMEDHNSTNSGNVIDFDAVGDVTFEVRKSPEQLEHTLNYDPDLEEPKQEDVEAVYDNNDEPILEIPNLSVVDTKVNNNMDDSESMNMNVMTPKKRPVISESTSEDYSSSSESEGDDQVSSSLSSSNRNVNTKISAPILTDSERESLKIDIPKEEEEEDNNSPRINDSSIEEQRKQSRSSLQLGDESGNVELNETITTNIPAKEVRRQSVSSTESDSDSKLPIKVEHQTEEEENNYITDKEDIREDSENECDVNFIDDDITFKKAKERFAQINDQRVNSLSIKNCELPSYIFNFIASKLETKKDLKKIELSGCEVEISLLKLLAKTLDKWPLLDTLILSNNVFVDYSLFDLMNVIGQVYSNDKGDDKVTLKLFNVSNCALQENDFGQIIKVIADNVCIETIVFDNNSIDRKLWQDLRTALSNNSNIKSISIKNCVKDTELEDEINNETLGIIRDRLIIN